MKEKCDSDQSLEDDLDTIRLQFIIYWVSSFTVTIE